MLLNRHGSSQHKLGSKFSYSDLYPMYANGRAWELKIPWLVVRVHSSGNFRWWKNGRLVWWWNQTACASHPKRILRILGLEAWVARWIWENDLTMSGGIGIHGGFKYHCLWHEGSNPSSWTNFKMAWHRAYPLAGMKFICNSSMPKYKDALVQIQSYE